MITLNLVAFIVGLTWILAVISPLLFLIFMVINFIENHTSPKTITIGLFTSSLFYWSWLWIYYSRLQSG